MAAALMHEPDILFLDEPTSGVDPLARREFWTRINALAEGGVTVLVTTHFMEEAEYCDRLAIMAAGEVLAIGTPAEIKAQAPRPDGAGGAGIDHGGGLYCADSGSSPISRSAALNSSICCGDSPLRADIDIHPEVIPVFLAGEEIAVGLQFLQRRLDVADLKTRFGGREANLRQTRLLVLLPTAYQGLIAIRPPAR